MSNGIHPRHPLGAGRGDSGTQPVVHYCTVAKAKDGTITGCPDWPACLFPQSRQRVIAVTGDVAAERLREQQREDWSRMWRDLGILAGWAFGAVLVFVVIALLLPVFG